MRDWQEETKSTFAKISEALGRRDASSADLVEGCRDESRLIYGVMGEWQEGLRTLLADKGLAQEEVDGVNQAILRLLDLPDGSPYNHAECWTRFDTLLRSLEADIRHERWEESEAKVSQALAAWRALHDRQVDWLYGLMSEYVSRFGEEAVPEMYDRIGGTVFEETFAQFDAAKHDWGTEALPGLLHETLRIMAAHLSTPNRDGAPLDLVELEDRWVIRFDPCGSGGRAVRGDWIEETPSRMEPPYNWRTIEGEYDWTDKKRGVCVYCNHCQVLYEHWPMDRFGYPLLVVEPPIYPDNSRDDSRQKCQYTIYKDVRDVPDEIYERSGRAKHAESPS